MKKWAKRIGLILLFFVTNMFFFWYGGQRAIDYAVPIAWKAGARFGAGKCAEILRLEKP